MMQRRDSRNAWVRRPTLAECQMLLDGSYWRKWSVNASDDNFRWHPTFEHRQKNRVPSGIIPRCHLPLLVLGMSNVLR
jgi:hypothetical protein